MEKLHRIVSAVLFLLLVGSTAYAGPTSIHRIDDDGTGPFDEQRIWDADWSWTHLVTIPATYDAVNSAVLTIESSSSLGFTNDIFFDAVIISNPMGSGVILDRSTGDEVGPLVNGESQVTTFDILNDYPSLLPGLLADGQVVVAVDIDADRAPGDPGHKLTIHCSELVVDFYVRPPEVIPAPGAALLGSLGVGLVGWLRRRRSI